MQEGKQYCFWERQTSTLSKNWSNVISYIVHNLTKNTIVLSDLRAEIGPHKMLDLEKVAKKDQISSSYDLKSAIKSSRLRLCSDGVVSKISKPEIQVVEKIIETHHREEVLDEEKMAKLMRRIMRENQPPPSAPLDSGQILDAVASLQKKIESLELNPAQKEDLDMPEIDPAKFAELQSRAIEKISKDIEMGNKKSGKRIVLKNTKLEELADELD